MRGGMPLTVACYKVMALILRLVMPQNQGLVFGTHAAVLRPATAAYALPARAAGESFLAGQGGDDCLGYTAIASKAMALESSADINGRLSYEFDCTPHRVLSSPKILDHRAAEFGSAICWRGFGMLYSPSHG